ncbi:MAG: DUF5615 family PIN-like protein [Gammaproteobacteria bacterium]|nr:DUF5615 family PIN-like protein [Gammaproteobacteria bacterium]
MSVVQRRQFQLWIDAQLPPSLCQWLQGELGVEALHVAELGLLREADSVIFERAKAAAPPVAILSKDEDFPRLVSQHGPPPQIVWLRCGNVTNSELRRIVGAAWPRIRSLLADSEPLIEIRSQEDVSG